MKTVINDKTKEYELIFESKKELEDFLSKSPSMAFRFLITYPFDGLNVVQEEVRVSILENDHFVFEFYSKNTMKLLRKNIIPIGLIKYYDQILLNAMEAYGQGSCEACNGGEV